MKMVQLLLLSMVILSFSNIVGCSKTEVVYVKLGKTPEETKGTMRIATNTKIPVSYGAGEATKLDLGGRVVLDEADLAFLLRHYIENPPQR